MEDKIVLSTLDDSFPLQHLFPFIFLGQFILSPSLSPYFLCFSFSSFLRSWGITNKLFTMIYNETTNVEIYWIIENLLLRQQKLYHKTLSSRLIIYPNIIQFLHFILQFIQFSKLSNVPISFSNSIQNLEIRYSYIHNSIPIPRREH